MQIESLQVRRIEEDTKVSKRTIIALILILICIPATIAFGVFVLADRSDVGDRSYYITSLIVIVLSIIPFLLIFEDRKPQAREVVIISVLITIAVIGRAAFFMLPQFKPIVAIVIIAAVSLGPETGFIIGSLTAFISNFLFGQGPWTPWQMFALGIIGFIAGVLFNKGILKKKLLPLCIFGALSSFLIYGVLLDTGSLLMFTSEFSVKAWIASLVAGFTFNAILAVATVFFLIVLSGVFIEKLDRVKKKYGILQV